MQPGNGDSLGRQNYTLGQAETEDLRPRRLGLGATLPQ